MLARELYLEPAIKTAVDVENIFEAQKVGDDASNYCLDGTPFCQRTREFKIDQDPAHPSSSDIRYNVDVNSVKHDAETGTIKANLLMGCDEYGYLAHDLELTMQFYEDGVMRTLIDTSEKSRFRISEEDLPVEWDQL